MSSKTFRFDKTPIEIDGVQYYPLILLYSEEESCRISFNDGYGRDFSLGGLPQGEDYDSHWGYADGLIGRYWTHLNASLNIAFSKSTYKRMYYAMRSFPSETIQGICFNKNWYARNKILWLPLVPVDIYEQFHRSNFDEDSVGLSDSNAALLLKECVFLFDKGVPQRYLTDLRKRIKILEGKPLKQVKYDPGDIIETFSKNPLYKLGLRLVDKKWQVEQFQKFLESKKDILDEIEEVVPPGDPVNEGTAPNQDGTFTTRIDPEAIRERFGDRADGEERDDMENFILGTFMNAMNEDGTTGTSGPPGDPPGPTGPSGGPGLTDTSETDSEDSEGITEEEIAEIRAMLEELSNNG